MGLAETAELAIKISLTGNAQAGIKNLKSNLGGLGKAASGVARGVAIGAGAAVGIAGAIVTRSVKSGLESLAELESATTSLDGAISQMGLKGKVTSAEIAGWANDIEGSIGAAFDDKAIAQATTTLIRFGKTTPENIRPAMQVITDLATKTGDVDSAASLLAKALADPEKAAGKLARQGVVLTKTEQDQIKAFVKAGKMGKAQTVILDAVAKSTKGAAAASQGPYARSLSVLKDVTEDAQRALATGFLPIIEEVRDILAKELAKPQTLARIKEFGSTLAGGLRGLVETLRGLPWHEIDTTVGSIVDFGKNLGKGFLDMPAEAKSILLGLFALNKLSGGAVINVGVDLLKGAGGALFQQFLGKGSPANPMFVVPVGGGLGGTPVPGVAPAASGLGGLLKTVIVGAVVVEGFKAWADSFGPSIDRNNTLGAQGLTTGEIEAQKYYTADRATQEAIFKHLGRIPTREEWLSGNAKKTQPLSPDETPAFKQPTAELAKAMQTLAAMQKAAKDEAAAKADAQKAATAKAMATLAATQKTTGDVAARKAEAQKTALERVRSNAITNRMETVSSQKSGDSQIVAAIERSRPIIIVNVDRSGNVTTAYTTGTTVARPSTKDTIRDRDIYR